MPYYDYFYVPVNGISDLNTSELNTLLKLLVENHFDRYIEVGVGNLGTLHKVARYIKKINLDIKCIGIDAFGKLPKDIFGNNTHEGDVIHLEDAENFLQVEGFEEIVDLYKGDSQQVLSEILLTIKDKSKLVFIDANHSYEGCCADFEIVDKYAVTQDIIVFHDTLKEQHEDYGRGPRGVVEDFLIENPNYRKIRMPEAELVLDDEVNTMSVFRRV